MTEEQLRGEAEGYQSQTLEGDGPAEDFEWHYDPEFPVQRVAFGDCPRPEDWRGAWRAWWQQECEGWARDYGTCEFESATACPHDDCMSHRFHDLQRWWLSSREEREADPVILVLNHDHGPAYLWDGAHRTSLCALAGHDIIPAIVGVRKGR
jgi:hypothetical protein